jgi:glycosyltransferase involved in cell wall biosynthesis
VKQSFDQNEFEVLVMDNGSTDNTKNVVDSYLGRIKNLRYFYVSLPGLHVGRHRGMKEASADILVFADDDIEAFPTWLEGIKESFEDKRTVLVGGKNLPKFLSEPPEWILRMWNRTEKNGRVLCSLSILDLGEETKEINPYYVFGCNFSIRKAILLEAGGFHPDAMPQELIRYRGDGETHVSKYISENKYRAIYNPKASVYHVIPSDRLTVEYFCIRAHNEGVSRSFSQIRDSHGLSISGRKRFVLKIKTILSITRLAIVKFIKKNKKILDLDIQKKIDASFYAGIRFHQTEVNNDPDLLAHVLRKTYLTN